MMETGIVGELIAENYAQLTEMETSAFGLTGAVSLGSGTGTRKSQIFGKGMGARE